MKDFLSDEHVAAVNGVVEQMLGQGKHVLTRQPQCITIGEVLRGYFKRWKEQDRLWGFDPWGVNYAADLNIENDKISATVLAAMESAIKLSFMGQLLVRKVGKLEEIDPHDITHQDYYKRGAPFWVMTPLGRQFYETLALPKTAEYSPAPRRSGKRADSGAMAPTAVA